MKGTCSSNFRSALCSFCSWLPWDFEIHHFLIRPQFLLLPEVILCYSGQNMIDQFPPTVHSLPPPLIHGVQFLSVNIGGLRLHAGADTIESHQFPRFRSDRSTFCNSILVQLTTPSPYRIIDTAQDDGDNLLHGFAPDLLFDWSRALAYAKLRTVLQCIAWIELSDLLSYNNSVWFCGRSIRCSCYGTTVFKKPNRKRNLCHCQRESRAKTVGLRGGQR